MLRSRKKKAQTGQQPTPTTLFDPAFYRARYRDIGQSVADPFKHYTRHGAAEGRQPHPLFDPTYYLAVNVDVRAAGADPLTHYLSNGWKERRRPHVLFDSWRYARLYGVGPGEESDENPLLHYLREGWRKGYSPHKLFDPTYYLCAHPDVAAANVDPLSHYLTSGWREGFWPNPVFDPSWYLRINDDVAGSDAEPLTHYLIKGWKEQRAATPDLHDQDDEEAIDTTGIAPLERLIDEPVFRARCPTLFDAAYYRTLYPDLAGLNDEALYSHFITRGAAEGRVAHAVQHRAVNLTPTPPDRPAGRRRRAATVGRPQYSAPLVIAGFHRSGTSITANILADAGLHLGDDLLGARRSNPYGHFEDKDVLSFHEHLLQQAGQTWQAISDFPSVLTAPDWRAMADYGFKNTHHPAWGFKDPRACLFLSEWASVFPDMSVLYVYRPCIECVHSLKKRAAVDYGQGKARPVNLAFFTRDDLAVRMYITYARKVLRFLERFDGRVKVIALSDLLENRDIVSEIRDEWAYQLVDVLPFDVYDGRSLSQNGPNELICEPELTQTVREIECALKAHLS